MCATAVLFFCHVLSVSVTVYSLLSIYTDWLIERDWPEIPLLFILLIHS